MSNITTLPNNISYYAAQDKKEDGSPILVLNLSQTYVEAIPERLTGVDRVVAHEGQVKYIAPDYKGEVVVAPQGQVWKRRALTHREIVLRKKNYQERNSVARGVFNQSYKANEICAGYPDEEMHLPSGLRFSWNPRTRKGRLDAQKTLVQHVGEMANIENVKLARVEVIQDRMARQAKFAAQCKEKNERRDHDLICARTHSSVPRFHSKSQIR
ncbi:MAG: hypothetical protein II938_04085 [Alphaproteobacteria bacterium]|nr:hypothetical protein [Alphaproteobacteria bacterium]